MIKELLEIMFWLKKQNRFQRLGKIKRLKNKTGKFTVLVKKEVYSFRINLKLDTLVKIGIKMLKCHLQIKYKNGKDNMKIPREADLKNQLQSMKRKTRK